jgi:SNF2 family DNA or RNA helicase
MYDNRMFSTPLYPFQESAREFVAGRDRAGFLIFYGGGKTFLALRWLWDLGMRGAACHPVLILCPKTLVTQWGAEIQKHTDFSYTLVTGNAKERVSALQGQRSQIYVINYDAVRSVPVMNELTKKDFRCVIADESTMLKEARTLRFKKIRTLTKNIHYRAILTGGIITERPEEVFSQMLFLDDGATFGTSFWRFRFRFFEAPPPWKPYEWKLRPGAKEEIAALLRAVCIYVPKTAVEEELPEKTYTTIQFDMPKKLRRLYDELKATFRAELPSGKEFETQWVLTKTTKLHQICQGFFYHEDGSVELLDLTKAEWVAENIPLMLLEGPVVIWSHFRYTLKVLLECLKATEARVGVLRGEDTQEDWANVLASFGRGELDVLLVSEPAGFRGLNLQKAHQVVFFDNSYSAAMRGNAEDRTHRIGSDPAKNVMYYDLVMKRSLDEIVLKALRKKEDMAEAILSHIRAD